MQPTQKEPDAQSLLRLLNDAFEGWGDNAYFCWKYTDFPRYDPAEHNFVVERDGDIVAARRVFSKLLVSGDDEQTVHVHGGTAVAEDHRQRGHYTRLVEESKEYSESAGSPAVMTFNREGKITTETHIRQGWEYRVLPACILPLTPVALIEQHASEVVGEIPGVTTAARLVTSRLGTRGVSRGIELAANGGDSLSDVVRSLTEVAGDVRISGRDSTVTPHATGGSVDVDPFEPDDMDAVRRSFERALGPYDLAFARGEPEIRHMVDYPRSESVVARDDDGVSGFASVGIVDRGNLTEARVLDLIHENERTESALLAEAERIATRNDADVISLFAASRPDGRWAQLRTEYVMWDPLTDESDWNDLLSDGWWRVTAYDVM